MIPLIYAICVRPRRPSLLTEAQQKRRTKICASLLIAVGLVLTLYNSIDLFISLISSKSFDPNNYNTTEVEDKKAESVHEFIIIGIVDIYLES
jgi:hypothetical protein